MRKDHISKTALTGDRWSPPTIPKTATSGFGFKDYTMGSDVMQEKFPKRKPNRLEHYDYSSCGAYFLTICTKERRNYFWENVGATIGRPQDVQLSEYGKIADKAINRIPIVYPSVLIEQYAIMPDHLHLLLRVRADEYGRPMVAPTMSRLVQQLKGYVTKQIGEPIWQKLFFDHVIRNWQDFEEHLKYTYENPMKRKYP